MNRKPTEEDIDRIIENFYESESLIDLLNEDLSLEKNSNVIGIILLRIFWKVRMDLDIDGNGYKNGKIDSEDVYNLITENIEILDTNHKSYKQYFKDLLKVVYYLIKNSN